MPIIPAKEKNDHVRLCIILKRLNLIVERQLDLPNTTCVSELKRVMEIDRYLGQFLSNVADVI